jgi:hypothetical protein
MNTRIARRLRATALALLPALLAGCNDDHNDNYNHVDGGPVSCSVDDQNAGSAPTWR